MQLIPTVELLQAARPLLPLELVSASHFSNLRALAERIPPALVLGLECRLRRVSDPVDLWICPGLDSAQLQKAGQEWPTDIWPDFAPLARYLHRAGVPWPASGAWTVEFDMASWPNCTEPQPQPSSFVTYGSVQPRLNIEDNITLLWRGSRGTEMPPEDVLQLRRLCAQCPQGELAGWGFLYPRPHQPGRLMLRVRELRDLQNLLGQHLDIAQRLLEGLTYQVVIGTPLYYEQEKRQSLEAYISGEQNWRTLAQRLCDLDYCAPQTAQALLQLALNSRPQNGTLATLNHVKLAIRADGASEVKAYPSIFRL